MTDKKDARNVSFSSQFVDFNNSIFAIIFVDPESEALKWNYLSWKELSIFTSL